MKTNYGYRIETAAALASMLEGFVTMRPECSNLTVKPMIPYLMVRVTSHFNFAATRGIDRLMAVYKPAILGDQVGVFHPVELNQAGELEIIRWAACPPNVGGRQAETAVWWSSGKGELFVQIHFHTDSDEMPVCGEFQVLTEAQALEFAKEHAAQWAAEDEDELAMVEAG